MKTNKRRAIVVLGSVLGAAALSGIAVAGNPHASGSASVHVSSTAGVKPSSTTSATGKNTNAMAGSTQTKLYGNGKTAGQIAMQNGASATTNLYGPGNSQPHKPVCPGAKPTFDVHALKAHSTSSCAAASTTATGSAGTSATVSGSASVTAQAAVAGKAAAHNNSRSNRSGGVLGSQHTLGKAKPARPVVGAANFTG